MFDEGRFCLKGYHPKFNREDDPAVRYDTAKTPAYIKWQKEIITDDEAARWLKAGGWLGYRVPLGHIVIDIDDNISGELVYQGLLAEKMSFYAIKTPRGYQFIFREPVRAVKQVAKFVTCSGVVCDFRLAEKGYIVYPDERAVPEDMELGGRVWLIPPDERELDEMPPLFYPITRQTEHPIELPILEGGRNDALFHHACRLCADGITDNQLKSTIEWVGKHLCSPALPSSEINSIIGSAQTYKLEEGNRRVVRQEEPDDEFYIPTPRRTPLPPDKSAFYGLAGDFVLAMDPYTEAGPAALLIQFLAAFGVMVGSNPYYTIGATKHPSLLFVVLIGDTSTGRKGTALDCVTAVFSRAVGNFWERVSGGFRSGEGFIEKVQEQSIQLVIEPEFASLLKICNWQSNTCSTAYRAAWDGSPLRYRSKKIDVCVDSHHIGIIGHITPDELKLNLSYDNITNGLANRHIWIYSERSKLIAIPKAVPETILNTFAARLKATLLVAEQHERVVLSNEAEDIWVRLYLLLNRPLPPTVGALLGRAAPQILRLAMVYALLDKSNIIEAPHLKAAVSVWDYCERTVEYMFGDQTGDRRADRLYDFIVQAGSTGCTTTDCHGVFANSLKANDLRRLIEKLWRAGRVIHFRGRRITAAKFVHILVADAHLAEARVTLGSEFVELTELPGPDGNANSGITENLVGNLLQVVDEADCEHPTETPPVIAEQPKPMHRKVKF
jgi:hypothetical protein